MKFLLKDIRGLIIDMDGVLWHGEVPLPGLVAFFKALRLLQLPFVLATNNASLTAEQYVLKLAKMGVTVSLEEILTSGMATASYLAEHYPADLTRVFVIGNQGAKQPLIERGFTITGLYETGGDCGADLVVSGLDRQLSWDKLATAALNIQAGAAFFATNGDVTLPTEQGCVPGNGATLAALKAATGVSPTIIGKPEPVLYQQALALLGVPAGQTLAVGDRLDTDILGAVRAGMPSLLVLSGISTFEDIDAVDYAPNWVMQDIQELTQALLHSRNLV